MKTISPFFFAAWTRSLIGRASIVCAKRSSLIAADGLLLLAASVAACAFESNRGAAGADFALLLACSFGSAAIRLAAFGILGVYGGIARYIGVPEVIRITEAMLLGSGVAAGSAWFLGLGYGATLLGFFFSLSGVVGLRLIARCAQRPALAEGMGRTLVIGAGDAGESLVREMLRSRHGRYQPVGFLDDDPKKAGRVIHDVPVLGRCEEAPAIAKSVSADVIVITVPSANALQMKRILEACATTHLPIRTVPTLKQIMDGTVTTAQIRKIEIDDIVGRDPVAWDRDIIGRSLRGKRILVTGAAGSIGSELCRMILGFHPSALALLDISENGMFHLRDGLERLGGGCRLVPFVASIADTTAVYHSIEAFRPDYLFHAAAHKHVLLMEENPEEAIANNVKGGVNVILACEKFGVEKMVNISTDKAVEPASIMGCSKRLVEMFLHDFSKNSRTKFCTVRFGNVLESTGSVIPIFREQLARGGPLTVTHRDVTRFFMSIPEAVGLVLEAATRSEGGEVFVLDMGKPVRILDLARHMIRLEGLEPGKEIEIVFSGLRHGEKIEEELWGRGEVPLRSASPHLWLIRSRESLPDDFRSNLWTLIHHAAARNREGLERQLALLLPRYEPAFSRRPARVPSPAATGGSERVPETTRAPEPVVSGYSLK